MTGYTLGMVATARPWRVRLQQEVRNHVTGIRLRVVMEERVALEDPVDVLLVDDDTSYLTPRLVRELQARGTLVVGVFDPDEAEGFGQTHLRRLGIEVTVPADTEPQVWLQLLDGLSPRRSLAAEFDEVVACLGLDARPPSSRGTVIAVGGPSGTGATEITIALAAALTRFGSTVLLDVDEVSPGVARRLGLPLHPHLLTAIDVLHADPDPHALLRCTTRHDGGFEVLAGIANRSDWYLLRCGDVITLLEELAGLRRFVVLNTGPHLESVEVSTGERFPASRAAVTAADTVVGVAEGSPRGVLRFLDWLVEAVDCRDEVQVWPVVNRCHRSGFEHAELTERLTEHTASYLVTDPLIVVEDRRVHQAAWAGTLVTGGPFPKAISGLAARIAGRPDRSTRRLVRVGR